MQGRLRHRPSVCGDLNALRIWREGNALWISTTDTHWAPWPPHHHPWHPSSEIPDSRSCTFLKAPCAVCLSGTCQQLPHLLHLCSPNARHQGGAHIPEREGVREGRKVIGGHWQSYLWTSWQIVSVQRRGAVGHTPPVLPICLILRSPLTRPGNTHLLDCSPHWLTTKGTPLCLDPASLVFSLTSLPQMVHMPPPPTWKSAHPS